MNFEGLYLWGSCKAILSPNFQYPRTGGKFTWYDVARYERCYSCVWVNPKCFYMAYHKNYFYCSWDDKKNLFHTVKYISGNGFSQSFVTDISTPHKVDGKHLGDYKYGSRVMTVTESTITYPGNKGSSLTWLNQYCFYFKVNNYWWYYLWDEKNGRYHGVKYSGDGFYEMKKVGNTKMCKMTKVEFEKIIVREKMQLAQKRKNIVDQRMVENFQLSDIQGMKIELNKCWCCQNDEEFSIVFLSDIHINDSTDKSKYDDYFKPIKSKLKKSDQLIIFGGDSADRGTQEDYDFLEKITKDFKIPLIFGPGNHDFKGHSVVGKECGWDIYKKKYGKSLFCVTVGSMLRIVFVDTCSAVFGCKQMEILESILKSRTEQYCIVVTHYSFIYRDIDDFLDWKEVGEVVLLLKKYRVNLTLNGHAHAFHTEVDDKLLYHLQSGHYYQDRVFHRITVKGLLGMSVETVIPTGQVKQQFSGDVMRGLKDVRPTVKEQLL